MALMLGTTIFALILAGFGIYLYIFAIYWLVVHVAPIVAAIWFIGAVIYKCIPNKYKKPQLPRVPVSRTPKEVTESIQPPPS